MHELQDYSYASQQALARLSGRLMQEFTHTTSRRPSFNSALSISSVDYLNVVDTSNSRLHVARLHHVEQSAHRGIVRIVLGYR